MNTKGQERVWVFVDPDALPESWAERARPMFLVPLLPEEAASFLDAEAPSVEAEDDRLFLRLIAEGLPSASIADELGIGVRAVERRVARLCRRYGVESKPELTSLLAKRGF